MNIIDGLRWRYATKKFDRNKKIDKQDLEKIKEAVRLSASSYGLQLYKVFIIEDRDVREKLKEAGMGQPQITDASHLFVFAAYNKGLNRHIDNFIELTADTRQIDKSKLQGFADTIKGSVEIKSPEALKDWTARQTYIALGTLLAAASELKIDACPMEGFKPDEFDEILGLKEQGLFSTVIAAIGYRSDHDDYQYAKKVRKQPDSLYQHI